MMSVSLNEFIAGGYFISKPVPCDAGRSEDLLPEMLLSYSGCICSHLPESWMFYWMTEEPESRIQNAGVYGISPEHAVAAIEWTTVQYQNNRVDYPGAFNSLDIAREFSSKYMPEQTEYSVYGLGLHKSFALDFLQKGKPYDLRDINDTNHIFGIYRAIQSGVPLAEGGERMGFDLLAFDPSCDLGCSWLCNGLERDFHERLGIRPYHLGLIDKLEDATRCVAMIENHELDGEPEPGLWLPWLIVKY